MTGTNSDTTLKISEVHSPQVWYHDGAGTNYSKNTRRTKGSNVPLAERPFIAWDGESGSGHAVVQGYHLFACVTPDGPRHIKSRNGLKTYEMLQFIVDVEEAYPDAIHIGFGFGYDVNQILGSLNRYQLETIHKTGVLFLNMHTWRLEWRKNKSLTITRVKKTMVGVEEERKVQEHRTSVVIYDSFSFFMSSFVKALENFKTCPDDVMDMIREGKARRGTFTYEEIDGFVLPYCLAECEQLIKLMEYFRGLVYGVGFEIRHWHGPGAIASWLLRHYEVKKAMCEPPEPVLVAAQHAYAAGRFELTRVGHIGPVWSVDINSAYPHAITQLPNLRMGRWEHVQFNQDNPCRKIVGFGVYRIKGGPGFKALFAVRPAPLWHRDEHGRISFPWQVDGWYWSPEASLVVSSPHYQISEAWVFVPGKGCDRPFAFVDRMYAQRQAWKAEGNPAEYALKLGMNSLYGKMAQRVGWDKKHMKAPPFHQLEWAGWVTSYCRAQIYRLGGKIGWENVVAIETDGLYVTRNPAEVSLKSTTGLGGLSIDWYEDCLYVQSGLAWLKEADGSWSQKYRGLDPESLPLSKMVEHFSHIDWEQKVQATTTRFIGIGAALMSRDYLTRWRVWETVPRLLAVGGDGKRIHIQKICRACAAGKTPNDMPHELSIALRKPGISAPHHLPWRPDIGKDPPWREGADEQRELLLPV